VLHALPEPGTVPVVLVPLADTAATPDRVHFDALFTRIDRVVVFTEGERKRIAARSEKTSTVVPMPVQWEANAPTVTGETDNQYVVVLTGSDRWDRIGRRAIVEFIAMANPHLRLVVANDDSAARHFHGITQSLPPIQDVGEFHGLIAGATAVVDLHPGRLYAGRSLLCLQAGTPLLVPRASRAREYCDVGRGGLWFTNGGELLWSLSALCDPTIGVPMGRQGQAYAMEHHGSFQRFSEQITLACGIREVADATLT
jgi:hypothetical protein